MTHPCPPPIPLIRLSGDHRSVGRQLGEARPALVRRAVERQWEGRLGCGRPEHELLDDAARCRAVTEARMPWLTAELDGVAEGAGLDAELLFAASIEELARPAGTVGRCTDVLLAPDATAAGHLLVAHNNDLGCESEEDLIAVEWDVPGDPVVLSVGVGPWISVGWNAAGLSLTGNEVSPNDERPGIPRLLLVRAQLRARSLAEAVALAVHPDRASAYNTVFATADGEAVNVEASATDCECTGPDDRGAIVHTNHYVGERMLRYEDDPDYAARSERRRRRARRLLEELEPSGATVDALRGVLCDHDGGRDAICRHDGEVKTVFWCVADVTDRRITYGRGNPCNSVAQTYAFA